MPSDFDRMSIEELQAFIQDEERRKAQEDVFAQLPKELTGVRRPQGLTGPDTGSRTPFLDPANLSNLRDRALGGLAGAAVGGPIGGAFGVASPPKNKSEWASLIAGGGAAKALAPLTKLPGIQGLLGTLGASVGSNSASLAGRALTGDDVTPTEIGVSTAASTVLPLAARGLLRSPAENSKYGQTRKSISKILGRDVEPAKASAVPGPTVPGPNGGPAPYATVLDDAKSAADQLRNNERLVLTEAENKSIALKDAVRTIDSTAAQQRGKLASILRKNRRAIGRAQEELDDISKNTIKDLAPSKVMNEAQVEELREKISESMGRPMFTEAAKEAGTKQINAAKRGELRIPEGPLDLQVENQAAETLRQNLVQNKMARIKAAADSETFDKLELPSVKKFIEENPAVKPELRHFVGKDVSTVDDFYAKVETATPSSFLALREQLSPSAKKEFENGFATHFLKKAMGPDGMLTNMPQAAKTWDYDKIAAVYGGDAVGKVKADIFQTTIDSTLKLLENNRKYDLKNKIGMTAAGSIPFIFYHLATGWSPASVAAKAGIAGSTAFVAVALPKIIDKAVASPKFGKQFERWAIEDATAAGLTKYPLVEKFLHDENVNKEKTPE